jgi:glutaredoxin-like YruB-family protein
MPKAKVKVYSTPTCPYCKQAKEFLKQNGIEYDDIDVAADQKAADEMVQKSGQMGVPVLDVDGTIIVGFDKEAIKRALKLK